MFRIGLLGASRIAPPAVIAPAAAHPDFTVTAVAARDEVRARAYADEHGIPNVARDYSALIDREDVDIVYNGLPPAAHAAWTIAALHAGKAVLCEKPFAMNAAQAREMVEAATASGSVLIEAFHYRFHTVIRQSEQLVSSGVLGRLIGAEAAFSVPIPRTRDELRWRADLGGGGMMDLGCYPLHALRTLIGAEPTVVSALGRFEDGVDTELSAQLEFPGGVGARLSCSMIAKTPNAALTLMGERGKLEIINFVAPQLGCAFSTTIDGEKVARSTAGPSTYEAQLAHVHDVLTGKSPPLTGGEDSIATMTAIDAIYRAAGRPV